jgi:hypothetical protein
MDGIRQCVARLGSTRPGTYDYLAQFCKVEPNTVVNWAKGEYFPKGEILVRLYVAVALAGIEFTEWSQMSDTSRKLSKLLAYDLYTPEDLRIEVEYAHMNGVYDFILRGRAALSHRLYKLEKVVQQNSQRINDWEKQPPEFVQHYFAQPVESPKTDTVLRSDEEPAVVSTLLVDSLVQATKTLDILIQLFDKSSERGGLATDLAEKLDPLLVARVNGWFKTIL